MSVSRQQFGSSLVITYKLLLQHFVKITKDSDRVCDCYITHHCESYCIKLITDVRPGSSTGAAEQQLLLGHRNTTLRNYMQKL